MGVADREVTQVLKEMCGAAFVNKTEAGRVLGIRSKEKCNQFLADVPCYRDGKCIMYFVNDLARKMQSIRTFTPYG